MKNTDIKTIEDLCVRWCGTLPASISQLPGAGSSRRYYRVATGAGRSVIATIGTSVKENEAFITMSRHFVSQGLDVPEVFAVTDDGMAYLQSDLGDTSLFDSLASARATRTWSKDNVKDLEKTLK